MSRSSISSWLLSCWVWRSLVRGPATSIGSESANFIAVVSHDEGIDARCCEAVSGHIDAHPRLTSFKVPTRSGLRVIVTHSIRPTPFQEPNVVRQTRSYPSSCDDRPITKDAADGKKNKEKESSESEISVSLVCSDQELLPRPRERDLDRRRVRTIQSSRAHELIACGLKVCFDSARPAPAKSRALEEKPPST